MKYFHPKALTIKANSSINKIAAEQLAALSQSQRSATGGFIHRLALLKSLRALTVLLLLTAQLACTATTLPPYEATYTTKLRGIKITGTRKFENTGENAYKVSWKAKALWMRLNEWSEFEVVDGKQIRPLSYHYTRKGLGTDRPIHIYFDWDNGVINASKGDKKYQMPLQPGTLDKLSYQVQMQMDLLSQPDVAELSYTVANHDRLKDYMFSFQQRETIKTGLGTLEAIVYARTNKDKTTQIWLSPVQYFLPVKIQQTEDGESSVLAIKNWKSDAPENDRSLVALSAMNPGNANNLSEQTNGDLDDLPFEDDLESSPEPKTNVKTNTEDDF